MVNAIIQLWLFPVRSDHESVSWDMELLCLQRRSKVRTSESFLRFVSSWCSSSLLTETLETSTLSLSPSGESVIVSEELSSWAPLEEKYL